MTVGIYTNTYKDVDLSVTKELLKSFCGCGIVCYAYINLKNKIEHTLFFDENNNIIPDMILAIGGDGTLLRVSKWCAKNKIPILGINMGKLGFLTEAEPHDFDELATNLLQGNYTVEKRTMLCATVEKKKYLALNEIVITRSNVAKMITINVNIDKDRVDTHYCDGFIVCTPTGSTAYSLSAGGPVISPTANVFSLTPINSHSMHSRPIVIGNNEQIEITLSGKADDAAVIADGKNVCNLNGNSRIKINKAKVNALFIRLNNNGFYERLLRKLNTWSITTKEET